MVMIYEWKKPSPTVGMAPEDQPTPEKSEHSMPRGPASEPLPSIGEPNPTSNVMLDLETLGTSPGAIILSIGAVKFDMRGTGETFYQVIGIDGSKHFGLTEDPATVEWWSGQSEEARIVIEQARDPSKAQWLPTALTLFNQFLEPDPGKVKLWGNGSDFDNVLLIAAYKAAKIRPAWRYFNHRCFRTLKNLHVGAQKPARTGVHHNALDDAITQAEHAISIASTMRITL